IPVPQPGPGEALIRVKAAAVCASDVHLLYDRFLSDPPVVIGHEFSGVVERLGAGVERIGLGDGVVSENNPQACGTCRVCALGFPNLCPAKKAFGFKSDGCFAEYVKLPANLLHKIPAGVSFDAAALCEPLAVATGAVVDRCGIADGDTVVVLGPGAIGLLAAQVARAEGAQRVIVAGTGRDVEHRLACGRRLGFETCNVEREDLLKRVLSCTGGMGADVVVEAAGREAAVNLGVKLLRRAGAMVVVGITGKPAISVAWDELLSRGATVAFSYGARKRSWDKAIGYLADGRVETEPLISGRLPLDRWEEAFRQMERKEGIRILLLPSG
ncbi:MAG: alcohol dehydrogenase catalytic domain-containing protein, partial [Planctomycetia bacterium]|nr:alcohol dehydrogenase catalytic domain-containing protein [Planctomycetia bacterium]